MNEYKYVKVMLYVPGERIECTLNAPIPCATDYFVDAFWMPIKHQIGDKLSLFLWPNKLSLVYNQAATSIDSSGNTGFQETLEQRKYASEESKKVFWTALDHIDRIMEHIYCKAPTGDIVPFIDEDRPIFNVEDNTITLNGRLPMQEAYFIKKYWKDIRTRYQAENKGVRFKIRFSDLGTKISVSAELCHYNALRAKKGLPELDASTVEKHQLQVIVCDLVDAIKKAASEYTEACKA